MEAKDLSYDKLLGFTLGDVMKENRLQISNVSCSQFVCENKPVLQQLQILIMVWDFLTKNWFENASAVRALILI